METDENQNSGVTGRRELRHWHLIFGTFLNKRLKPVNIQVELEVKAAKALPTLDILLLRPAGQDHWNEEQRAVLPDGLRSCGAGRIVIEFKYSESFGTEAVIQTQVYDWLYRKSERLSERDVKTFLVCSKSPNPKRLAALGYVASGAPGVYHNTSILGQRINLISLNELTDEPHNLAFKLFASKNKVRIRSLKKLQNGPILSEETHYFLNTLRLQWQKGEPLMMTMTEEEILAFGKTIEKDILRRASYQDRLEGIPAMEVLRVYPARELLNGIPLSERLEGIPASERLEGIPASERLEGIPASERLKGIPASERLEGIPASERLKGISTEELRNLIIDKRFRDLLKAMEDQEG